MKVFDMEQPILYYYKDDFEHWFYFHNRLFYGTIDNEIWSKIVELDIEQLPEVLFKLNPANQLLDNWDTAFAIDTIKYHNGIILSNDEEDFINYYLKDEQFNPFVD